MYRGTFFYAQTGSQNLKLQNSKHSYLRLGVQYGQTHSPGYRVTLMSMKYPPLDTCTAELGHHGDNPCQKLESESKRFIPR